MAKKKVRKLLKGLGVGAALLGAGKALMNARDRKAMLNAADANEGFIDAMSNMGSFIKPKMMTPKDMEMDPMFFNAMAAKGGRIKKTKRGGRAVRKANRSKKK